MVVIIKEETSSLLISLPFCGYGSGLNSNDTYWKM